MITFNIKDIARNLMTPNTSQPGVKEHLASMLLEGALTVFNDPHLENDVIGNLEILLENEYDVLGANQIVKDMLADISEQTKHYGWDSRAKAKVTYKSLGKGYYVANVVMDLEDTVARMLGSVSTDCSEHITDVVSDNPDMDTLNALNTYKTRDAARETPLFHNRFAAFVQEDQVPGWRTEYWTNFGKSVK